VALAVEDPFTDIDDHVGRDDHGSAHRIDRDTGVLAAQRRRPTDRGVGVRVRVSPERSLYACDGEGLRSDSERFDRREEQNGDDAQSRSDDGHIPVADQQPDSPRH